MYTYRKACIVQVQAGMCTCRRPCTRTGRHVHVLAGMCTYITSCVHAGGHVHLQTGYARTGRHVHVQAGMCMYKPACASAGRHVHVRARTSTCRRACARAGRHVHGQRRHVQVQIIGYWQKNSNSIPGLTRGDWLGLLKNDNNEIEKTQIILYCDLQ